MDGRVSGQLCILDGSQHQVHLMTPVELTDILNQIVSQLGDIMSFGLGGLTGIAFVIAASMRW